MKPYRVLFIIPNLTLGGIQKQVYKLALELKGMGFHPIIAGTRHIRSEFTDDLDRDGIEWHNLSWWTENWFYPLDKIRLFNSIRANRKIRKTLRPDVIFSYTQRIGFMINIAWQLSGAKKSYFMERNGTELYNSSSLGFWTKVAILNTSLVITNSEHAKVGMMTLFHLPDSKVIAIKNYVNDTLIQSEERPEIDAELLVGKRVFLMVANFWSYKNHDLLINAWKSIADPGMILILAGQGIEGGAERRFDADNGIYFTGGIKDAQAWIALSDVCILSSFAEGCPNVVLEYIIGGKLFIGSNIPGIREVLPEKFHSLLLFDNSSIEECIDKIRYAAQNFRDRSVINECKSFVLSNYSVDGMVSSYASLLSKV